MTIWKYPLEVTDRQTLTLPPQAKILTVQMQHGHPCLWALVDERTEMREARAIAIHGTGHPMAHDPGDYIGTFQIHGGSLVFHVFEVKS